MTRQRQLLFEVRDVIPMVVGLTAARLLQPGAKSGIRHQQAIKKFSKIAGKTLTPYELKPHQLANIKRVYEHTAYWHGTGRYQWLKGQKIDVLKQILDQKTLTTHLDKYDPRGGEVAVATISVAHSRLYARCYADMHHANPDNLNRFLSAQYVAGFFIVRPYFRHMYLDAASHPKGLHAGFKEQRRTNRAREAQLPQHWILKIRRTSVSPMFAFRAGSDIPGNYGILFGLDNSVQVKDSHEVFAETRESRSGIDIPLSHVTHIEVPQEHIREVQLLLSEYSIDIPVLATEDFEMHVSTLPMSDVLGIPTIRR